MALRHRARGRAFVSSSCGRAASCRRPRPARLRSVSPGKLVLLCVAADDLVGADSAQVGALLEHLPAEVHRVKPRARSRRRQPRRSRSVVVGELSRTVSESTAARSIVRGLGSAPSRSGGIARPPASPSIPPGRRWPSPGGWFRSSRCGGGRGSRRSRPLRRPGTLCAARRGPPAAPAAASVKGGPSESRGRRAFRRDRWRSRPGSERP